jgi:nicotinamide phosphoribosyltransferase
VVADSYDLDRFLDEIVGVQFKDAIATRNGTLVIRPDSGNPVDIVIQAWR